MTLVVEVVLQPLHHIVVMKDQMEAAQLDRTVKVLGQVEKRLGELIEVQELEHQQAVDDGIYKLHQTCIVRSKWVSITIK